MIKKLLFLPGLLFLLIDVFLVEPNWMKVSRLKMDFPGLRKPLRILFLSDFQLRKRWGYREKWIVRNMGNWEFDIVCVAGDVFDTRKGMQPGIDLLKEFSKRAPTYVVLGNWEHWSEADLGEYAKELRRSGIHILINESKALEWKGEKLWIVGVDDPVTSYDDLAAALQGIDGRASKILLSHAPVIFPEAAAKKISLVLAGHNHGGQVRFPLIGALYHPPGCGNYLSGVYHSGESTMLLTTGIGMSVLPVRFLCRPEVILLTLQ